MNRKKAISWCTHLRQWPTDTSCPAPYGWKWVIRRLPYQLPQYLLQPTGDLDYIIDIAKEDIVANPDKEFLQWIHDRLKFRHGENPNVDYMLKLQMVIDEMPGNCRWAFPNGKMSHQA